MLKNLNLRTIPFSSNWTERRRKRSAKGTEAFEATVESSEDLSRRCGAREAVADSIDRRISPRCDSIERVGRTRAHSVVPGAPFRTKRPFLSFRIHRTSFTHRTRYIGGCARDGERREDWRSTGDLWFLGLEFSPG